MACELIILDAVGQGQPGAPLMSLKVTGSATNCSSVSVSILCTGQHPVRHDAVQVVAGQWETTFTANELKVAGCLECGSSSYPLEIRARCDDGIESCAAFRSWSAIACASTGDCCPTVSFEVTEGACDAQGRRIVTFKVTITPAMAPGCPDTVFAQLDFGDGMLGAGFTVPPNTVWQETHPYVPASYTAKLHIISPRGCPDIPVKVGPLVACPPGCPSADDITVAVDDCDAEGRRIVALIVDVPGYGQTTGSVDWLDGSTTGPDTVQGGSNWTVFHHYPPPGPYKAIVSIAGCPPITKAIGPLAPCHHTPPPDKEWPKCRNLRWAFVIFTILAAVAAYAAGCIVLPPPLSPTVNNILWGMAAAFAVAAVIVYILWRYVLHCPKPCGWDRLLGWQVALGTGIGALYFAGCCGWMWILAFFLILSALVLLYAWYRKCHPTFCRIAIEMSVVVAGVVLPVVGWLLEIPGLAACVPPGVGGAVAAFSAAVALAVAGCASEG